jgi:hypothetical protein
MVVVILFNKTGPIMKVTLKHKFDNIINIKFNIYFDQTVDYNLLTYSSEIPFYLSIVYYLN